MTNFHHKLQYEELGFSEWCWDVKIGLTNPVLIYYVPSKLSSEIMQKIIRKLKQPKIADFSI